MSARRERTPWNAATLFLALLAAGLIVLDRWPDAAAPAQPLTHVATQQLATLRIERNNQLQLAFKQDSGNWRITHPVDAPVSPERISQLLAIARAPVRYRFQANGDLTRYGLEAPAATLYLGDTKVLFGDREPSQSGRYALVDGQIAVVDDVFYNLLSLPSSHFVGD